ncbi:MAG: Flp pilus assembly complex ATPase component TadA [Clostridia bacterium]|nr:Flp pilus assembly complex ATPase component TadA [Clostridia bacterium]
MLRYKLLSEILVENKLIDQFQLEEVLKVQKRSGKKLGEVLVEMGFLTEQDIIDVLELQLGIKQIKLAETFPHVEALKYIPKNLALKYKVIPIAEEGDLLVVAMADPLDIMVIDELRLRTGKRIKSVIATEKEITEAIDKFYSAKTADITKKEETAAAMEPEVFDEAVSVEQMPIVRLVNSILSEAMEANASDIHLEPGKWEVRVRFRIDGLLREVRPLPLTSYNSVVSRIKIMAGMDIAEKRLPQDGRIQQNIKNREIDIRVSSLPTVYGEKIVMRLLDRSTRLLKLGELGFSEEALKSFRQLIQQPFGMILVTGPTGSGKTTTLYAALNEISSVSKNIVTIEDPVEYVLPGINQVSVNQKAGLNFAVGLRSILRQDPDVIMIGEIRDMETAKIAVRAANTGHLVFSTLHTNDAPGALTRLLDMGVEPYLVATTVIGVVAQRLARRICNSCKQEYIVPADSEEMAFLGSRAEKNAKLYTGAGCKFCGFTGYKGRMAVTEILNITSSIRRMVVQKHHSEVIREQALSTEGFVSMKEDGIMKAFKGLTTLEEIMRIV